MSWGGIIHLSEGLRKCIKKFNHGLAVKGDLDREGLNLSCGFYIKIDLLNQGIYVNKLHLVPDFADER